MKKSTIVSLLALSVLTLVVYSCIIDKDKSTQDRLIGKWSMVNAKWNDHYNNTNHYDSASYGTGLFYAEFKTDGTVIASSAISADKDTSIYKIVDNDKLVIDGDTSIINSISDNDFQLYYKEVYQNNEYYEEWSNFKK
jgi:hypothetical protein